MKRREFVIKSSLITTSILAPMSLSSCTSSSSQNRVGIQLYSVRDEMNKNPKETLKNIASYGYKYIEGYEGDLGLFWGMSNVEYKNYLDSLGLTMIASHCGDTNNLVSFNEKCQQASEIGVEYLICPWAECERSVDGFKSIAKTFNECGEIAKKHNMQFSYHNHDYSFKKIEPFANFCLKKLLRIGISFLGLSLSLSELFNYGFTAIIVAFLGRLHPIGIIFASLIIALTYLGAEDAQLFMQIPAAVGFVFQGLILFYLLGADLLVNYKLEFKG